MMIILLIIYNSNKNSIYTNIKWIFNNTRLTYVIMGELVASACYTIYLFFTPHDGSGYMIIATSY